MRKWILALLLSTSAVAEPAKFHLSGPIDTWVELRSPRQKVHLRTLTSGAGDSAKSELEITYAERTQRVPLDTVTDESNSAARGEVIVEDFDFDGIKDIGVPTGTGYGGVNIYYNVFRLDPKSDKFVPLAEKTAICNPEFDIPNKILVTNTRSGPCWYGSDYKFNQGAPWLFRRRNMAILDGLLVKPDVAYLIETLEPNGQVLTSQLSSDSIKAVPEKGTLESNVMLFPSPGSRGLSGHLSKGQAVRLDCWETWGGHEYARATSGKTRGWVLMDKMTVRR